MIFNYLFRMPGTPWSLRILMFLFSAAAVVCALSVHEVSHGLMALACGDDTAKNQGRLSLNPLRHLDITGALMLMFFGFGWAKAVEIHPYRFRNAKRGTILTAAAGPFSNFLLSFVSFFIYYLLAFAFPDNDIVANCAFFFYILAVISVGLGVFNLIPLPPLDGSKILEELLPVRAKIKYQRIEAYSFYILIGLILLSNLTQIDFLQFIRIPLMNLLEWVGARLAALFF